MKALDGLNMDDLLKSIGGPGVDLGASKKKETVTLDEVVGEEANTSELVSEEKGGQEKVANLKKRKKKVLPKVSTAKDKNFSTTGLSKELINIIRWVHPDRYIRDVVNEVLWEWAEKHESELQKQLKKSFNSRKK